MRLWSLHPSYLDAKGLVALWREGLLARKVLLGQTRGYRYHPQLTRFRAHANPVRAIDSYLWIVHEESVRRGYHFDVSKLGSKPGGIKLRVTDGQLRYELEHLKHKLKQRDKDRYRQIAALEIPQPHPLFKVVVGEVEEWERNSSTSNR
jgi:Pyrimidine dimer DNA glycosylase